jgi:hypothetical protein
MWTPNDANGLISLVGDSWAGCQEAVALPYRLVASPCYKSYYSVRVCNFVRFVAIFFHFRGWPSEAWSFSCPITERTLDMETKLVSFNLAGLSARLTSRGSVSRDAQDSIVPQVTWRTLCPGMGCRYCLKEWNTLKSESMQNIKLCTLFLNYLARAHFMYVWPAQADFTGIEEC